MNPLTVSFGIVTERLAECRDFYSRHFGFTVTHDHGWYMHLQAPHGEGALGLVAPNRADVPASFHAPFAGNGVYMSLKVADVNAALREMEAAGVPVETPLQDAPWGERHFVVRDPAGCLVNVWQSTKESH
jgi:catechol 2,3-dioxygenase-like lactoylglutathione lyase family enzyme